MTREELIERVNKFQGANREFSQELPPIVEALCDEIDAAGPEVVDSLTSNSKTKALSANQGKNLKEMVDEKIAFPEVAGEAGQFLGVDAEGNPEWQPVSSTGEPADAEMSDTSTNAVQNKVITEELDKCAKKDGYYDSLTAGLATNLVDTKGTGTEQEFIRRTSCGNESISDDGTGVIQEIKGKTIAWNQLVQNSLPITTLSFGTISKENGIITLVVTERPGNDVVIIPESSFNVVLNHIYIWICSNDIFKINNSWVWGTSVNKYTESEFIANNTSEKVQVGIRIPGDIAPGTYSFSILISDLTLLGLGDLTADQFRTLYPALYYAPASVLKSNDAAALLTDGFNQWDEEWELGSINTSTGENQPSNEYIRTKNYIPVIPGQSYYLKCPGSIGPFVLYDANKVYLGVIGSSETVNKSATIPAGCYYIRSNFSGNTYNNDICINLSWSGYRNGEYEPYWKRVLALRLSELTGIPVGGTEADRVTMFPNGLGGVGSALDSIFVENGVTKARKTMERKNLGDVYFIYSSPANGIFRAGFDAFPGIKGAATTAVLANAISQRYTQKPYTVLSSADNLCYAIATAEIDRVVFINQAYTDAAAFKAAMAGVYLEYELATPIVYTDLQYADGTPFTMPKVYQVADFGTETIVQPEGTTEPSAPFRAIIKYNDDFTREIVNLPENYDTTDGIDALCSALATALSSALNGTLTITRGNYSESDKRYAFTVTFTPNE